MDLAAARWTKKRTWAEHREVSGCERGSARGNAGKSAIAGWHRGERTANVDSSTATCASRRSTAERREVWERERELEHRKVNEGASANRAPRAKSSRTLEHRKVNERKARSCTPRGGQVSERSLERRKASEKAIAAPMRADVNTREVSTDANIDPMSSRSERRKAITHADIDADARGPKCIERCAGPRTLIRDARSDIARWTGKRALQNTNVRT